MENKSFAGPLPTFELPWPPAQLSPNARSHWGAKSRYAKAYRYQCKILTLQSRISAPDGDIHLQLTFCPPDSRRRDDDNCLASFKSGRDGIADALKVDDNRFQTTFALGEPRKGGAVLVSIAGEVSV